MNQNTQTKITNSSLSDYWLNIQTVFLDMDGTLLDLYFDNHFWRVYIPKCYAQKHNISYEAASQILTNKYKEIEGTLSWYSVDYWTDTLALDIIKLKHDIESLINIRPGVIEFLQFLKNNNKKTLLVTNAHNKSLQLKMNKTQLTSHFDEIICSHDLGYPKENIKFWQVLKEKYSYNKQKTLLIDDSLAVLRSAQQYGIQFLLGINQPDSQAATIKTDEFMLLDNFPDITPA